MKAKKSVLIAGGSSFVGTHLAKRLRENCKVFMTYHHNPVFVPGVTTIPMDPLNRNWVKRVVYTAHPDVVIYLCGANDTHWAEKNYRIAERIHAGGAASLASTAEILSPKFIFVSNSYVFDGRKGNYKEDDIVLPWIALGKAKLNGENYIRGRSLNYIIVRSAPVFGIGNGVNFSFLDHLRINLSLNEKVSMPTKELHSFAPVYGLVDFLARLVDAGPRNKILHYGGITKMSYLDFARSFAERFGFDPKQVFPAIQKVKQKHFSEDTVFDFSLNCSQVVKTLNVDPFGLEEGFDLLEKELTS